LQNVQVHPLPPNATVEHKIFLKLFPLGALGAPPEPSLELKLGAPPVPELPKFKVPLVELPITN